MLPIKKNFRKKVIEFIVQVLLLCLHPLPRPLNVLHLLQPPPLRLHEQELLGLLLGNPSSSYLNIVQHHRLSRLLLPNHREKLKLMFQKFQSSHWITIENRN